MKVERLQGTDGIRREVVRAGDPRVRGLSPLRALLERDLLTDQFFELYAYAFARDLLAIGGLRRGGRIAVGWDGRDRGGVFVDAALQGLSKAGARPYLLGIAPTPALPLEMIFAGCGGGLMITASHNPANQNGLKTFYPPLGLKPLPRDDQRLTQRVLELDARRLLTRRAQFAPLDGSAAARERFVGAMLLDLQRSHPQVESRFAALALIVDAANGALSGIAAEAFRHAGIAEVIEVNADPARGVNAGGGAADLEGVESVAPKELEGSGRFREHLGLQALLRHGRRRGADRLTAAAVFDADGDRLHLVLYDPWEDYLRVLTGDDASALQTITLGPGKRRTYAATVESDLAALRFAARRGFRARLTVVGDKWLLREALRCELRDRARRAAPSLRRRLQALATRADLAVADLIPLAQRLPPPAPRSSFAIGGEMTGHTVRGLTIEDSSGRCHRVYAGNALLAALHGLAALGSLLTRPTALGLRRAHDPSGRGFKASSYAYFTDQAALDPRRPERARLAAEVGRLTQLAFPKGTRIQERRFQEEPELLYLEARSRREVRAAVFVRNSGTEDKTGAQVRGRKSDAGRLGRLLEQLALLLQLRLKDLGKPGAQAALELLEAARKGRLRASSRSSSAEQSALLKILEQKEGLLRAGRDSRFELTPRGARLLGLRSLATTPRPASRGGRPAP